MRVFVSGATGVVGRRVVPLVLATGHGVTALARRPDQRERLRAAGANAVAVDLLDDGAVRAVVAGRDAIVNLATHIPPSAARMLLQRSWPENDRLRRDGTGAVADAAIAQGVERVVQESFAPIYEDGGDRWLDERAPVRPTAYNRTVLDAERAAASVTAAGGAGVVLRFASGRRECGACATGSARWRRRCGTKASRLASPQNRRQIAAPNDAPPPITVPSREIASPALPSFGSPSPERGVTVA